MSPMLASTSGGGGDGGGAPGNGNGGTAGQGQLMDDGNTFLRKFFKEILIYFYFPDRYFQCEPMDATVSPIALTHSAQQQQLAAEQQQQQQPMDDQPASNPGTPGNR